MTESNNNLDALKSQIFDAFSTCSNSDINFMLELLELVLAQDSDLQSQLVQYICELWSTVQSSNAVVATERVTKSQYEKLKNLYGDIVDAALVSYTNKGISEGWSREEFYQHLWNFISTNVMWEKPEEKAFALYYIAIDVRTPYFNIGTGLKMNQDDFSRILSESLEAYKEFRFISALSFSQKTEEASLVLKIINRFDTEEKKVVFLSMVIGHYTDRINKLINKIRAGD